MSISCEKKVIVELVRLCYNTSSVNKVNKLLAKSNEDKLNNLIAKAGIAGVLNYYLVENKELELSESLKRTLKQHSGMIGIKNSVITKKLLSLVSRLNERNIDYIVLKGVPLATTIYQDDSMRAVSDIDLLIKRSQYDDLKEVLLEQGYIFPENELKGISERFTQEWVEKERSEILFVKKDKLFGESKVDVHFDMKMFGHVDKFNNMFPLNEIDWFNNKRLIMIEDTNVACLAYPAELFYCIMHYSIQHSFMGIKWLIDICQMSSYAKEKYIVDEYNSFLDNSNFKKMSEMCFKLTDGIIINSNSFISRFRMRLFEDPDSAIGKVKRKLYKSSLPDKFSDKLKFIKHYLFEGDSIKHRLEGSEKIKFDILQPFKLYYVYLKERRRQKK